MRPSSFVLTAASVLLFSLPGSAQDVSFPGVEPSTPTATAAVVGDSWRYVWDRGIWWYYQPNGQWLYWTGTGWNVYVPGIGSDRTRSIYDGPWPGYLWTDSLLPRSHSSRFGSRIAPRDLSTSTPHFSSDPGSTLGYGFPGGYGYPSGYSYPSSYGYPGTFGYPSGASAPGFGIGSF